MKLSEVRPGIDAMAPLTEAEALIRDARQRERHRRIGLALVALLVIGLIVALADVVGGGGSRSPSTEPGALLRDGLVVNAKAFAGGGYLAFESLNDLYVLNGTSGVLVT